MATKDAAQMAQEMKKYNESYDAASGLWTNGYTTEQNVRMKANQIRQKMLENSQAWHTAGSKAEKDALHQENLELNQVLNQYAGGVESSYDGKTGRWTTANRSLGYGDVVDYDRENAKRMYGVSDAQLDAYLTDTGRYYEVPGDSGSQRVGSARNAAGGAAMDAASGSGGSGSSGTRADLDAWRDAALRQAEGKIDYAVEQGVGALQRAEEDAKVMYQTQRDQNAAGEANALDNAALYAELRGDRGGIGLAQYNSIQNQAAENKLAINAAQVKLATDTQRQIADLRAQGEMQKAEKLLEVSQEYLKQLMSLEQWAAEYQLSNAKFQQSVREWENEFALSAAKVTGDYRGTPTLSARQYNDELLKDSAKALLAVGVLPSEQQLAALGVTKEQARLMMRR